MRFGFAAFLALMGCYTEDNYADTLARQSCSRFKECERGDFDAEYTSTGDCTEEVAADLRDWQDCYLDAGCEYDPDEAKFCSDAITGQTCEEWSQGESNNDCDEIYDCSDSEFLEVLACLAGF